MEWKLKPQRNWQKHLPWLHEHRTAIGFDVDELPKRRGVTVEAIGFDADEASGKRRSLRYSVEGDDSGFHAWFPLAEWGINRARAVEIIHEAGLPSPGKSACFHCPVSKSCELQVMEPAEIGAALDLESRFRDGKHFKDNVQGLGVKRQWADMLDDDAEDNPTLVPGDLPEPELVDWAPEVEPQLTLF